MAEATPVDDRVPASPVRGPRPFTGRRLVFAATQNGGILGSCVRAGNSLFRAVAAAISDPLGAAHVHAVNELNIQGSDAPVHAAAVNGVQPLVHTEGPLAVPSAQPAVPVRQSYLDAATAEHNANYTMSLNGAQMAAPLVSDHRVPVSCRPADSHHLAAPPLAPRPVAMARAQQALADPESSRVIPIPTKMTPSVVAGAIKIGAATLTRRIKSILDHVARNAEAARCKFPDDILAFLEDDRLADWHLAYLSSLDGGPFEPDAYIQAAVHYLIGEVRPPSSVALSELIEGQIKQALGEPVATYAERFFQRSRLLPSESQASLCRHYIAGLLPDLRRLCALDRDGREHTVLTKLAQFSFAEETRLKIVSPSSFPSSGTKRPQWIEGFRPFKKSRPFSSSVPASGAGSSRDVATAAAVISLRDRPVEECPLFKKQTSKANPLTPADRAVLSDWAICYYCKAGRHAAKDCPCKKGSKAK